MASVPRGGGYARADFERSETNKFSSGKHQNRRIIAKRELENPGQIQADALVAPRNLSEQNRRTEPVDVYDMPGYTRFENRVRISLKSSSRSRIKELTMKLKGELDQVRSLVKKFEAQELQIGGNGLNPSQFSGNNLVEKVGNSLKVSSEVGSAELPDSRLVRSASVAENFTVFDETEARMPITAKQCTNAKRFPGMFPPSGCKSNGGKNGLIFKSCRNLLDKLMKSKNGWVFNKPVDAKGLGLHDYHEVITKPMDLGTIKERLKKNWYKSPRAFAEDVRLTFSNSMTYNPRGHDIYIMAEQLWKVFEEKWAVIESKQQVGKVFQKDDGLAELTPTSRKSPALGTPVESRGISKSESMTRPLSVNRGTLGTSDSMKKFPNSIQEPPNSAHPGRLLPVSKKPKAKDHENRDMTFEEKQRLSIDLQNLPSEKLTNVVKIIKKRNQGLFQNDDEIELDIGNVDSETLWELDRFVANYKKAFIKNKRKAGDNLLSERPHHSTKENDVAAVTTAGEPVGNDADSESDSSSSCGLDANPSPSRH